MSYSIEDTQPGAPFQGDPLNLKPTIRPDEGPAPRGGSCLLTGLIIGMFMLVAIAIVALAGAAGWTSGQREANANATATQNFAINEQIQHISGDVDAGNLVVLGARIQWLATQTPAVPGIGDFIMTATALYNRSLPTATLPSSPTPEASTEEVAATEDIVITQESSGGYDLAAILSQAQGAMASSQWDDATRLLDVIIGTDPNFQSGTVRSLMSQALTSEAMQLYNAKKPAEANLLVDRAEEFGPLPNGLDYERYAAELYLKARAAVGTGSPAAISALQELLNQGAAGRYYTDAQQLLYNLYIAQGDAYMGQGNSCAAVGPYQNATGVLSGGTAYGKLAAAQSACANATPTPDPNVAIPSDGSVAPVGVVATPG